MLQRDDHLTRDPALVAVTAVGIASMILAAIGSIGVEELRALVLPFVVWALVADLGLLRHHRRRRFWRLWTCAVAAWWLVAVLGIFGSLGGHHQVADLVGYLFVVVSLAVRPRAEVEEGHQAKVHRLRMTALITAIFSVVGYALLLADAETAGIEATRAVLGIDLVAAGLFLVVARKLDASARVVGALLGGGFLVFGVLHSIDLAAGGLGGEGAAPWRVALEVVPFWLFALGRRLHFESTDTVDDSGAVKPFPLPGALWIALLPLLHLLIGPSAETRPALLLTVLLSTALLLALSLWEHSLVSRRNVLLELEQARVERETETRAVYLRSLIEHNPLAIVVLDEKHRVKVINPAFEQTFGYAADEVLGTTLDGLITNATSSGEASTYTLRVMRGETVHDLVHRRRKDGTEIDAEMWGVPLLENGELVGIFAIYQDVTDRVRSETALRESQERFRRLSDATFEGLVVSEQGMIVDCNEQFARLMGGRPDQIIGRTLLDFVADRDQKLVSGRIAQGTERAYEHHAKTLDDREILVEVHGRSLPSGQRDLRVTAVRDITATRRLEEEVRQAQKMEAVGRLAGGIAHDFNNVLTVVKGYAQLLGHRLGDDPLGSQVSAIHDAAERASLLTQRLLAFGRKQPLTPRNLDLNLVLQGLEKMLRHLIRADIDIAWDRDPDLGPVKVDQGQIEQVVLNLVINAGDAMPRGGTLRLSTRNVQIGYDVGVPPLPAGSYVSLEVQDSGTGMDEATLSQVFEPFFTTKEKGKGTGLGLATVYAIVQQNGGVIDVESVPGEGSTFRIFLPRVGSAAEAAEEESLHHDLPGGTETVLVVEDEPAVRALATEFLASHGYRVIEAGNGREGLDLFGDHAGTDTGIDLVLTDVVMPGMNGPEMVRRLRTDHPALPVLFMSGYTDEILGPEDLENGGRLVHKPFSIEELLTRVRAVLDGYLEPV